MKGGGEIERTKDEILLFVQNDNKKFLKKILE